ncbi:phosphoribosylglycinamide synthetase C domain-containing protein [Neisseria iguanae]|uniref:phosphoribosylglycinamide synthetase C domain-containing protein n=1 Tax=Neisseria iguanae TaxID=90242 RepID=UPI003CCBDCB4
MADSKARIGGFRRETIAAHNQIITNGSRVQCVAGLEDGVAAAKAYTALEKISFNGIQYRKDIAGKAVSR